MASQERRAVVGGAGGEGTHAYGGQVWLLKAADRFGDHGTVGVLVLRREREQGVVRGEAGGGGGSACTRVVLLAVSCRVPALVATHERERGKRARGAGPHKHPC